ncbi:MAG TPA: MEDS domain-containing protein [Candidatus Binatia bacterium]|nr:MEDS domain-containing protein [Candidatus Binatia bacterium]
MSPSFITELGLPGIRQVPYGLHACQLYSDAQQLVAALVPFFSTGLKRNELCLWTVSDRMCAEKAHQALTKEWPDSSREILTGRLRILDYARFDGDAGMNGSEMVQVWLDEERRALLGGYEGLRIAGEVPNLSDGKQWGAFMDYERQVTAAFADRRIVSLCNYHRPRYSDVHAAEILRAHHCVLRRAEDTWEVLSSQGAYLNSGNAQSSAICPMKP